MPQRQPHIVNLDWARRYADARVVESSLPTDGMLGMDVPGIVEVTSMDCCLKGIKSRHSRRQDSTPHHQHDPSRPAGNDGHVKRDIQFQQVHTKPRRFNPSMTGSVSNSGQEARKNSTIISCLLWRLRFISPTRSPWSRSKLVLMSEKYLCLASVGLGHL